MTSTPMRFMTNFAHAAGGIILILLLIGTMLWRLVMTANVTNLRA